MKEELIRQVETAKNFLRTMQASTEEVLRRQITDQVDQAYALSSALYDREQGRLGEGEVKRLVIEALRPIRFFNGKGYYFVDDMDGNCLLLPINPNLEGTSLLNNRDDAGTYIMRSLISAANNPSGEGFSRYRWYAPGSGKKMLEKIAYVRKFEPYNWLIGTGQYISDVDQVLQAEARNRLRGLRFGPHAKGYFVIYGPGEKVLVSPSRQESEDHLIDELPSDGRAVAHTIFDQGQKGDGFVRYDWAIDGGTSNKSTKLVYVSKVPDWDWVISAGLYLDDLAATIASRRAALDESIRNKVLVTVLAALTGIVISLAIGWKFSHISHRMVESFHSNIAHKNQELEAKTRTLEQSNADLEQFAYVASHDLQTPLRNIVRFAQLLERRYKGRIDSDADAFIGFIVDGGKHMTQLISDLLEFSRVSRQSAPLTPISATEAITQALKNLELEIAKSEAEVNVDDLPLVMADQTYLVSLFQNLVGNGIKYGAADRKPVISVSAMRVSSGRWRFAVTDNGIGIEPQYQEKVFEIFQRLDPTSRREGTGIGLTLCRRIVHRFGGAIWLESIPGEGTTLFFTLQDGSAAA
ncbi:Phytochrome two-component sensor histidine kinase Cyanobacterial phytochrome B [Paramagnetospirillum magnetotacticum MS-1]|uniref:histidine kinase n=2 Tax=Paramagnetospirillum magnetotacticum TaxID=188 RepID=A0A0C2YTV4_PARME|nr:Phytochrome two-component sensor histidine kinase Cyanobacterial phytochrome B [Paramagnetospirillum magnetotacticum MS-1]